MDPVLFALTITTGQAQVVSAIALIIVALGALLETRRTRKQAIRPVIALDLVTVGASLYVEVGVANVGQGAAFDLDLELSFMPDDGEPERARWTWPLLRPGQHYQFGPPDVGGQTRPNLDAWAPAYPRVTLTGTVRDQLNVPHDVDLELRDISGLRARAMDARLAGEHRIVRRSGGT